MTSNEYVIWLKGFVTAVESDQPSQTQWEELVETLNKIDTSFPKNNIFDKDSKSVFDFGKITIPNGYWKTNSDKQDKQLLND